MGRTLRVRALTRSRFAQAFPLVQAIAPGIALKEWLDYARAIGASSRGGVVSAEGNDGYIYGLFCYAVENDLRHGKTLAVTNMVVLDMIDSQGVAAALAAAMERIARQKSCGYTLVTLPHRNGAGAGGAGVLIGPPALAGHQIESVRLAMRIGKGARANR
jgi:hypothetical protein